VAQLASAPANTSSNIVRNAAPLSRAVAKRTSQQWGVARLWNDKGSGRARVIEVAVPATFESIETAPYFRHAGIA
jgi:hypothetical protein